jgi:hypothetical protein
LSPAYDTGHKFAKLFRSKTFATSVSFKGADDTRRSRRSADGAHDANAAAYTNPVVRSGRVRARALAWEPSELTRERRPGHDAKQHRRPAILRVQFGCGGGEFHMHAREIERDERDGETGHAYAT